MKADGFPRDAQINWHDIRGALFVAVDQPTAPQDKTTDAYHKQQPVFKGLLRIKEKGVLPVWRNAPKLTTATIIHQCVAGIFEITRLIDDLNSLEPCIILSFE